MPELFGRRSGMLRLVCVGLLGSVAAGCSSDSVRWSDSLQNPFRGPSKQYAATNPAPTPAPAPAPVASAPIARVESQPIAPPVMASPLPAPETTGSIPTTPSLAGGGWTWEGGTTVTAQAGDTAASLSQRYGVPKTALLNANNLTEAMSIQAGQKVVIPVYRTGNSVLASAPATVPAKIPALNSSPASRPMSGTHTVEPGETLSAISHRYGVSRQDLARANGIGEWDLVRVGQKINVPGAAGRTPSSRRAEASPAVEAPPPSPVLAQTQPATPKKSPAAPQKQDTASAAPVQAKTQPSPAPATPKVAVSASQDSTPPSEPTQRAAAVQPTAEPETTGEAAGAGFRWPVRGRVISGFGAKTNGHSNDGINLSVPEGTPIKAAEDGVVAYAGNELKNYGNLVLIRHSNGYVSAYAHGSELLVKRGDTVKRGQVIGKAGQTGGVSAPQVHFEIRKGSTPVDPMPHLTGG